MRSAMLSCAFASAILGHTAFLSQDAVAGPRTWADPKAQEQPRLKLAQNTGPAKKVGTGGEQKMSAEAEADGHGQMSVLAAAARAEKGKEAPIPAVDEETLSLYPTAAQCGECHKQIYEEWSSSQHAYSSISPMFHAFEQKFQELTKGTVGTFCVRCHQQVGTQLGEKSRNAALGDEPDLARGRDVHHLPPGRRSSTARSTASAGSSRARSSSRSTAAAKRASSRTSSPTRRPTPSRPARTGGAPTSTTA